MAIGNRYIDPLAARVVMVIYLIAVVGTVGIIVYQVYVSVITEPVWWSAMSILDWAGIDWAENPSKWKRFHAFLRGVPICGVYFLIVAGIGWNIELIFSDQPEARPND